MIGAAVFRLCLNNRLRNSGFWITGIGSSEIMVSSFIRNHWERTTPIQIVFNFDYSSLNTNVFLPPLDSEYDIAFYVKSNIDLESIQMAIDEGVLKFEEKIQMLEKTWSHKIGERKKTRTFLPKDEFESSKMYAERLNEKEVFLNEITALYAQIVENEKIERQRQAKEKILQSIKPVKLKVFRIGKYDADAESFSTINLGAYSDTVPTYKNLLFGMILKEAGKINKASNTFKITADSTQIFSNYSGNKTGAWAKKDEIFDISTNYSVTGHFVNISLIRYDKNSIKIKDYRVPLEEAKSFKENILYVTGFGTKRLNQNLTEWEYFNIEIEHPISKKKYYFNVEPDGLENSPDIKLVPPSMIMRWSLKKTEMDLMQKSLAN